MDVRHTRPSLFSYACRYTAQVPMTHLISPFMYAIIYGVTNFPLILAPFGLRVIKR